MRGGEELIKGNGIYDDKSYIAYKGALEDSTAAASDIIYLICSGYVGVAVGLINPLVGVACGIIYHLFTRLLQYAVDNNNEKVIIEVGKKQIAHLDRISKKSKGKEKQEIDDIRDKIQKQIEDLEMNR